MENDCPIIILVIQYIEKSWWLIYVATSCPLLFTSRHCRTHLIMNSHVFIFYLIQYKQRGLSWVTSFGEFRILSLVLLVSASKEFLIGICGIGNSKMVIFWQRMVLRSLMHRLRENIHPWKRQGDWRSLLFVIYQCWEPSIALSLKGHCCKYCYH